MFYPSQINNEVFNKQKNIRQNGDVRIGDVAYISDHEFRAENSIYTLGVCEVICGYDYTFRLFNGKQYTVRYPNDTFKIVADKETSIDYLNKNV